MNIPCYSSLIQVLGQHSIFSYDSRTKFVIYQMFKDHVKQIKNLWTTLYIGSKYRDHLCQSSLNWDHIKLLRSSPKLSILAPADAAVYHQQHQQPLQKKGIPTPASNTAMREKTSTKGLNTCHGSNHEKAYF